MRPAAPSSGAGRERLAGAIMLVQSLMLLLGALLVVAVPHSVCHVGAGGVRRCGQSGEGGDAAAFAGGAAVVLAVAVALLVRARWAPRVGLGLSGLLTAAGLGVLVATFAGASADDRSTYGALWVLGLIAVALLAAPLPLLWPRGGPPPSS